MAQRVNFRARFPAVLLAALVDVGCSRSPDVVATKAVKEQKSDAMLHNLGMDEKRCLPGHYEGTATSDTIPFKGSIDFTLVQTGNELKVLRDTATLDGNTGDTGGTFHATISSAETGCKDGAIKSTLEYGTYQAPGGPTIPFHGSIKGQYFADFNGFVGGWSAFLQLNATADAGIEVGGSWSATLIGQ